MNPAQPVRNTGAAAGYASAVVIIMVWLLGLAGVEVPAPVAEGGFGVLFTGLFGFFLHRSAEKSARHKPTDPTP